MRTTYAWFALSNNLESLTKIKAPTNLDIKAGNQDSIINFDLSGVDIEEIQKTGAKGYVFSIDSGNYKTDYDIQLAHTTNIPFTYTLYHATEVESNGAGVVVYTPLWGANKGTEYYYKKGEKIDLAERNVNDSSPNDYGRKTAKDDDAFYNNTYDEGDKPELYAVPVYLQTKDPIKHNETTDKVDFFVLELGWDNTAVEKEGFARWNIADNNKETDIIYITAEKHTN